MKINHLNKQNLLECYNCGPVKLSGDSNAFYERHFTFDQVVGWPEHHFRGVRSGAAGAARRHGQLPHGRPHVPGPMLTACHE